MLLIILLWAVGLGVRAAIAYRGGISADEGFVLQIVAVPSWSGMVEFLRLHESHPPLFYLVMRAWMTIAGTSDNIALILPVVVGSLLTPAVYFAGRSLFSVRTGLIAAALVAVSPSLSEHAAQLRPYGVLQLLTLLSCWFLASSLLRGGVKRWIAYSVSTALLLYTHNWAWLVVGGQGTAVAFVLLAESRGMLASRLRWYAVACLAIAVAYGPWVPTLLFQLANAGHLPVDVSGPADWMTFVLYALVRIPEMLFLGSVPVDKFAIVAIAGAAAMLLVLLVRRSVGSVSQPESSALEGRPAVSIALRVLFIVPAAALTAATLYSPRSNLLLDRCVAILAPLLLVGIAHGIERLAATESVHHSRRSLSSAAFGFLVVASITNVGLLLPTTRSNAREVARSLSASVMTRDLLIVAPEWYTASFNHYFAPSIEQIDYPYQGRAGMIDFSDAYGRGADTTALVRLRRMIAEAEEDNRRVWFVSDRKYIRYAQNPGTDPGTGYSKLRVRDIYGALSHTMGAPDTTHFVKGRTPRYDELVAMLFVPRKFTDQAGQ